MARSSALPEILHELARELPLTLSKDEVCALLKVSRVTFERAVAARELHVIKRGVGRTCGVIVTRSEVLRWMAERAR